MIMAIKLQYALNDKKESISIDNPKVKSGEDQIYYCPDPYCKERVNPKKGQKRQHHFSHKAGSNCFGPETSLHLLAKEVIASMEFFYLPNFYLYPHDFYSYF